MIRQKIIDYLNSKPIGYSFTAKEIKSKIGHTGLYLKQLCEAGYLSKATVNYQTNKLEYATLKHIPAMPDRRKWNGRPSKRPHRIIVHISWESAEYLSQFDNKSKEVDRILRTVDIGNVSRSYIENSVRLSLSISQKAYDKLGNYPSATVDKAVKNRPKVLYTNSLDIGIL